MQNDDVMIHVRFSPDGTVREIGARRQTLSAQDWFNRLSTEAAGASQALSGGRGPHTQPTRPPHKPPNPPPARAPVQETFNPLQPRSRAGPRAYPARGRAR